MAHYEYISSLSVRAVDTTDYSQLGSTPNHRPLNRLQNAGAGVAAGGLLGTVGSGAARQCTPFDTPYANYVEGESTSVAGGEPDMWTFAASNSAGKPTHLGNMAGTRGVQA